MSHQESGATPSDEERLLREASAGGVGAKLSTWTRLSGPGWLQSAITLGGGSLASALYLGVLGGTEMLWLQVVAMLLGIVMLGAIAHVTLSTGRRPFEAIRTTINPVLAWGWLLAVLMANVVWSLPQFSLGTAAVQQNLFPSLAGTGGKWVASLSILAAATAVIWCYGSGSRGVRIFEVVLKSMVGVVVLCFFGVVATLAFSDAGLDFGAIASGLVPDLSLVSRPARAFEPVLDGTGSFQSFWRDVLISEQRDVMIAAAATAVGINMTFLLPYSMLRKGWNRHYRGLALFDLATGLLVPFVIATGCVVIASSSQFHARADETLVSDTDAALGNKAYMARIHARLAHEHGAEWSARELAAEAPTLELRNAMEALPTADREIAAMILKRDAFSLASALEPLTGHAVSQVVFGIGVLGMAISTVIILMLISGFAVCELLGVPATGTTHRVGCLLAGVGVLGPFVWSDAKFWLAVPTSVFGMALLPLAYITFFLMMNSRQLMGDAMPRGGARVAWNGAMLIALAAVVPASLFVIWSKVGVWGLVGLGAFLVVAACAHRRH